MDPASFVVAEQAVSTTVEGAAIAGIGLAQSTQPLSATFTRITSEAFLPRSSHSITVISGKVYIYGGEESPGKLADDNVHIIKLPAKKPTNVGEPEYKCIPSMGEEEDGQVPGPRTGHTACALGHRIYVFGGRGQDQNQQALEEKGKVWMFNTESLRWSCLEPSPDGSLPPSRYIHSAVASEHPLPNNNVSGSASYAEQLKSTVSKLPAMIGKGSPPREAHGSIIVCSGFSSSTPDSLTDLWTFTITTKTWSALPSLPSIPFSPSLAFANNTLYALGGSSDAGSEIHYLQLQPSTYNDARGTADLDLKAKTGEWSSLPFPTNPLAPGPQPRKGAGLHPITTGNGRLYLLYFMGEKVAKAEKEETQFWSDTWSYQTPAVDVAPAGIKDKTRSLLGISTGEGTWCEVKVVPNEEGSGGMETEGKSHPGPRGWFGSCALGKDSDGGGVVLWGGINAKGETEGEGWLVSIK
ncbi:MAG: hypothetical protein LQ346_007785 [Caloplaca aetnensis]|nr:MAG: hypothetical protein LQ346_007785 [Caloplaca aetnensis]